MGDKRGRKRKEEPYFGPKEEEAVIRFLETDDIHERNKIYNECLRNPIDKMVESIIRTYKLYRKGISFEELHSDTVSYLIWKSEKFESDKGKKAYSYYGTICKNYLLGLLIKDDKQLKSNSSFEDSLPTLEEREDMIYYMDDEDQAGEDFIKKISNEIKEELENSSDVGKKKMTENERKLGEALVELLDNWENILEEMEGGSKYTKAKVLSAIRDYTNLNTKDIRVAMRRYKSLYFLSKNDTIENGYL